MIKTVQDFKKHVKVNKSLPFEVIQPFIHHVRAVILVEYFGVELLSELESEDVEFTSKQKKLIKRIDSATAPFALMLGISELSVRMSDSGFTVDKKEDNYVPASDKKIETLRNDLRLRGYQLLNVALDYVEKNIDIFPTWQNSIYYQRQNKNFIRNAQEFQDIGAVNIGYDRFVFDSFLPTITLIEERYLMERMGLDLFDNLKENVDTVTGEKKLLLLYIRRFVALKTAEIYTSESSKQNRQKPNETEYTPVIRPLFLSTSTRNFYAEQSNYYWDKINDNLNKNAEDYGIEPQASGLEFNNPDRKIFVSFG